MLSGVSHDLRTPLTRMRLTVALMEESDETRDLRLDMDQMERMLGEFLAFARGDGLEAAVASDPFALAAGIAENARRGGTAITVTETDETPEDRLVQMRPGAVGRAVQNLVGNAARHGSRVGLQVRLRPRRWNSSSRTTAPASAEADRARALTPFNRSTRRATRTAAAMSGSACRSRWTWPAATAAAWS